jgi:glycosyltransferase involved in cell wall biosynthesis
MRVALLSRAVRPLHDPGGMERSVLHLARHLHRRGIETTLFTRPATQPGTFPGAVVTVPYQRVRVGGHGRVLDRTFNYPAFVRAIGQALAPQVASGAIDVVHAQGMAALGYSRLRRANPALRAPVILNPQGMEEHKTRGLKRLALVLVRRLSIEAASLADRVIATDEVTRGEVPQYLGVDPRKVVVLPNAVDLDEIAEETPADAAARVRAALPRLGDACPILLSVGRIEGYKGFGDVLDALVTLHGAGRLPARWAWIVLGEGTQRPELEARIASWDAASRPAGRDPLGDHIHFAGWVRDDAALHAYYTSAQVFVHATHYEGSSIVTLEAMAHGLPVVATRTGGIPDKVITGVNGVLVAPRDVAALTDGIAMVAGDAGVRAAMGAQSRERVAEHFNWNVVAERTIEVYRDMLADAGLRPADRP